MEHKLWATELARRLGDVFGRIRYKGLFGGRDRWDRTDMAEQGFDQVSIDRGVESQRGTE